MVGPNIAFWIIALVMAYAGVRLVTTRNVVHAALYLMIVLAGTAAIFLLLGAEFLGWTQVLVYIGAIVVLFLFGVMLTRATYGESKGLDNDQRVLAATVAVIVFLVFAGAMWKAFGASTEIVLEKSTTVSELGRDLMTNWVLPFEAVSLVLLASLIGAITLARRDDPEHVRDRGVER
ncbi:MAG: NADH-quinone oxidoreductase subunit J [Acidimicrobiia bacterium]|nr:NADH-quinone oxidoreductase subunit J [Acidimicrobiia bacterium]